MNISFSKWVLDESDQNVRLFETDRCAFRPIIWLIVCRMDGARPKGDIRDVYLNKY